MTIDTVNPWLVFADDWGRHPSSCQHLIRHVLPSRPVIWVNTIGTRPPRLDWSTLSRAMEKFKSWARPRIRDHALSAEPQPVVLSPKMWPSFRTNFARKLNRRLLTRALQPIAANQTLPPVVITTLPLMADLVGTFPAIQWVYYCVDDFTVWPGYDGETMRRMEVDLINHVDTIVCVSEALQERIRSLGRESHLLSHGVDVDFWCRVPLNPTVEAWKGLEPPYILFWGVIDKRMDVQFLQALSHRMTNGTIVLVGPREDLDVQLLSIPRVALRSAVPIEQLPSLASAASVLIMPYDDIPATRAMQPLKLKEYLATGKPAVVRDLPATRSWADAADLARTPEQFANCVLARLQEGLPENQRVARRRLSNESWQEKARLLDKYIHHG